MSEQKKITIACVNTALHEVGGETRRLRNLYLKINGPEHRFLIAYCSRQKEAVEKFFLEGGADPKDLFWFPTSKSAFFIPLVMRLRKLYLTEKVDIMHSFFLHSDILGFISAVLAGVKGKISNVEGKFLWDEKYGVGKLKQLCYFLMNRIIRPHFYKTVAVSNGLKEELIRDYGLPENSIEVINIGIEIPTEEEISVDHARQEKNGHKIIANAARFSRDKGLEYLVRAAPKVAEMVPEARFIIAGQGGEEQNLKKLVSELQVEDIVSFPGWVKDMNDFMRRIDIFAMTSIREGSPMSLSEALSYKKAAVAFDVPGPQEVIVNGENGVLVKPFDVDEYSSAIIKICKDPSFAEKLGRNGRRTVEEKLGVETEARKLKDLYARWAGSQRKERAA